MFGTEDIRSKLDSKLISPNPKQGTRDKTWESHGRGNSVFSNNDSTISRESSTKAIITCGAKIRNISHNRVDGPHLRGIVLQARSDSKSFVDSQDTTPFSTASKYDAESANNLRLLLKRCESEEINLVPTNVPRVSTFLDNTGRLNDVKTGADSSRTEGKVTMQSVLIEDRERLQQQVRQKSLQILTLNRSLNQQRKSSQGKLRQLQLQVQMGKYTHQQSTFTFTSKLQALRKQNTVKDSLISQLTTEVRKLQSTRTQQSLEFSRQKLLQQRDTQQWRNKLAKSDLQLGLCNKTIQILSEQKVRQESVICNLRSKTQPHPMPQSQPKQSCTCLNVLKESQSNKVMKTYRSLQKLIESPKRLYMDKRPNQSSKQRLSDSNFQTMEEQRTRINTLEESQKKLQQKIKILENMIQICNSEIMGEKIRQANSMFKQRY